MTAGSFQPMQSAPVDPIVRLDRRVDLKTAAIIEETGVLRRCAMYRAAFKGTAVSYPATLLSLGSVATWMRRHRVPVDVATIGELNRALLAGINPEQIIVASASADAIRSGVAAGASRFVVESSRQVAVLANSADRIVRVLLDASPVPYDGLVSTIVDSRSLDLVGLHRTLDGSNDGFGEAQLREMIAEMARIRRDHGLLLSRISLAGLDVGAWAAEPRIVRRVADAIYEVVGEACAQYRFPRPALTLSPARSALMPSH